MAKKTKVSKKSFLTTLLLCLFLGMLGIHRFYVGRPGVAVLILILTFTGIGMVVSGIIVLVDFIIIAMGKFKDGEGLLIKN